MMGIASGTQGFSSRVSGLCQQGPDAIGSSAGASPQPVQQLLLGDDSRLLVSEALAAAVTQASAVIRLLTVTTSL